MEYCCCSWSDEVRASCLVFEGVCFVFSVVVFLWVTCLPVVGVACPPVDFAMSVLLGVEKGLNKHTAKKRRKKCGFYSKAQLLLYIGIESRNARRTLSVPSRRVHKQ